MPVVIPFQRFLEEHREPVFRFLVASVGRDAADALRARILKIAPVFLAFTSLTAGRAVLGKSAVTGRQEERIGETIVWVLPSPSPLADNHWDIGPWRALARAFRKL